MMSGAAAQRPTKVIYEFTVKTIKGKETTLLPYEGQLLLIVNVASRCGYTKQYAGLEALHRRYQAKGFSVLGFPCNQFGGQEPGSELQILEFCSTRYDVTFPLFAKIDVNGENAQPLYIWLKSRATGILGSESNKWNFTKFLVDQSGNVIGRYAPNVTPAEIETKIAELLG